MRFKVEDWEKNPQGAVCIVSFSRPAQTECTSPGGMDEIG